MTLAVGLTGCVRGSAPSSADDSGTTVVPSSSRGMDTDPGKQGPVSVVYGPPRVVGPMDDASSSSDPPDVGVAPRGQVSQGLVEVKAGPVNNVERKIAMLRAGLRRCYFDALTRSEGARGDVTLTLEVAADGKVQSVKAKPDDGSSLDAIMLKCLESRLKVAAFEMADPPRAATVSFRALFKLSEPTPGPK